MGELIRRRLADRGIAYHPGRKLMAVDGAGRRLDFEDGSRAGYDLLIAIPPHVAPAVVRAAGLVGPSGWVPVDPERCRVSLAGVPPGVFAVGDVTTMPLPGRYRPDQPLALPKAGVMAEAQGVVVADAIAAEVLGVAPGPPFDGRGFCYLETGSGQALRAEGDFFALPHPTMAARAPDAAQLADKRSWVARHL
jgi:sulfide:quinone oxidoreductase